MVAAAGHLSCPYCCSYDVDRLYVASVHLDACRCGDCGSSWDEDAATHEFRGRSHEQSALVRQEA